MNYYVRVKQGHPAGVRRRSGLTFTQDESMVSESEMTDEIRTDAWLQVRVVGEPLTPSGAMPNAGEPPLSTEERERLTTFAANLHASAIAESDAASAAAAGSEEKAEGAGEKTEADAEGGGDKTSTRRGRGK
jgi:hypothetical protein